MTRPSVSPVYSFLRNPSMVDFPGHLSAVFFLSGCNFRCGFCHNAPLLAETQRGLAWERLDTACRDFAESWVTGAVVTGGEPTLAPDLPELLDYLRAFGWALKLDTNGSRPDVLAECLSRVDYVAMDIKTRFEDYAHVTGFSDTDLVRASVDLLIGGSTDYEFRTTIIDGVHSDECVSEIAASLQGARRYILQPFVPREDLPDRALREIRRTPSERLQHLQSLVAPYVTEASIRG